MKTVGLLNRLLEHFDWIDGLQCPRSPFNLMLFKHISRSVRSLNVVALFYTAPLIFFFLNKNMYFFL